MHTLKRNRTARQSSQLPGDPACNPTLYSITPGIKEVFVGNSAKPRLSIGVGVNWNSPFGPLRIDLAKALLKQKGDDTKLFSFNVGTSILMKILLLPAALAASVIAPAAASAQSIPPATIAVVDLDKVSGTCNACRTAQATLQGQVNALKARETALATPLQTER